MNVFFCLKAVFKINGKMHFGTNNLCGQIVTNTIVQEKVKRELAYEKILVFKSLPLQDIALKILNKKDFDRSKTQLLKSRTVNLNSLDRVYLQLFYNFQEIKLENLIQIEQSEFAWSEYKSELIK